MLEFAGALILLITMVFGISEIGRALYQLNTLTKSVEAGARYMSRSVDVVIFDPEAGAPEEQCGIVSGNWEVAMERARNIVLYGTEVTGNMTRLPEMDVTEITVMPRIDAFLSHGGACVIKVTASAKFISIFDDDNDSLNMNNDDDVIGELVLTAEAQERYIGE